MGNSGGGGGIDWDPFHSTLGTAVSGNPGAAWEQVKSSINPADSTAGTLLKGNIGKAGQDIAGGIQNGINANLDILGAGVTGVPGAIYQQQGREAAQRQQVDRANAAGANQQAIDQQMQANATAAANQKNMDYQSQQANMNASLGAEDAYNRARNAARQARGTALFGAYNG